MNSKEFLKNRLFNLSAEYPATTIKYYFDAFDNDHFVCIYPNADLEDIIAKKAIAIDRQFIENFPTESLSFIEVDYNLIFDELVAEFHPVINSMFKIINFDVKKSFIADRSFESSFYNLHYSNHYKIEDLKTNAVAGCNEFALAA